MNRNVYKIDAHDKILDKIRVHITLSRDYFPNYGAIDRAYSFLSNKNSFAQFFSKLWYQLSLLNPTFKSNGENHNFPIRLFFSDIGSIDNPNISQH